MTDQKLGQAKKTRDYLEVQVEAAELKKDLNRLLSGIENNGGSPGSARPLDRVREAYVSGLEIKALKEALGSGNGEEPTQRASEASTKQAQEASDARARIVEALVKAGKKPEEIEAYLTRLGPFLDVSAVTKDPVSQLLLYSRFNQGGGEMNVKDTIETFRMLNEVKGSNGGKSDVAELAGALVEAFKAGKEQAQVANPGMGPFQAYQEGMKAMQGLMAQQNEGLKVAFQEQIKHLEEKVAASDPIAYIKSMKEAADTLGFGGSDKEIALAQIDNQDKRAQREFEREKTLWEMEKTEKREERKDKRQVKVIDNIMKGVETALESPVIKEAGKYVGSKMEGKIPDIRGQAARSQLNEPMQEVLDFECANCHKKYEFTRAELVAIQNRGGRWVCSTQGCGKAYNLAPEGGLKK